MALVFRSFFLIAFLLSASDFFMPCFGVNVDLTRFHGLYELLH
jgi:hypothetical protein